MSATGGAFSSAVVVVFADLESAQFSFWHPQLNKEVQLSMTEDAPLEIGDWIFVDYNENGSVAAYEMIENCPFQTTVEGNNGEIITSLHAYYPLEAFAKEHDLRDVLLSTNLGRVSMTKECVDMLAGFQGKGFAITAIGSMNPTERAELNTMWVVDKIYKKKKISQSEKDVFSAWFEKHSNETSTDLECEDTSAQYASIQKFQKKRNPSASSFEHVSNFSTTSTTASSFSVVSAQQSLVDSHSLVEDRDTTLEAEEIDQSQQRSKLHPDEVELIRIVRDLVFDADFAAAAEDRYPLEWPPVCRTFAKYEKHC